MTRPLITDAAAVHAVREISEQFLNYQDSYRRASPATIKAYRANLCRLAEFLEGARLPQDVTAIQTRHIQAFAMSLGHLAPASINRKLNAISSFFSFAERQGLVERNPVRDVERPRVPEKLPDAPTLSQVQSLVAAAQTERDRAMLVLISCCGLRRSELLDLAMSDLSADLGQLKVREAKGGRERALPVPAQCREILRCYLEEERQQGSHLFVNGAGNRIGNTGFYRIFRRLLKAAGLDKEGITPHSLRHFYGTALLQGRADVETVRTLLGHRDLRTTCRYLHATEEGRQRAVEQLPMLTEPTSSDASAAGSGVAHSA